MFLALELANPNGFIISYTSSNLAIDKDKGLSYFENKILVISFTLLSVVWADNVTAIISSNVLLKFNSQTGFWIIIFNSFNISSDVVLVFI